MRFSHFLRTQVFDSILMQHASIFAPKIHQNRFENRSWKASIFKSMLASIFYWFWLDFGSPLGAMLATFSVKMGVRCGVFPSFCLGRCSYPSFWPSWPPSCEKCRVPPLDFERFWPRFWNVLGSILKVSGDYLSAFRCPFSSQSSN